VTFVPERDIENAGLAATNFGGWPCFHDAEIVRLTLQREGRAGYLECVFHVFNHSHDFDGAAAPNHILVRLRFDDIELQRLEDFNFQNVIDDLSITPNTESSRRFRVNIPANNGCDATFLCNSIKVISAEPYTIEQRLRDGSVYAER
jgi:hypothetical protein